MLTSVDLALRQNPAQANLELTTRMISNFLGPPPNLQLSEVCEFGTIALLDWIWSNSCTNPDDRSRRWSLTNYLRSDPLYHRWQFAKSLYVAAEQGDLEIVEWLFTHFDGFEAPTDVVSAAAHGGNLHVLRYLWEHRTGHEEINTNFRSAVVQEEDKSAVREDVTCTVKFDHQCREGNWGLAAIKKSVENGQLRECVNTGMQLGWYDREAAITHAVNIGQDELAEKLLREGESILEYAYGSSRPDIIRKMMDSGRMRWDEEYATWAFCRSASSCSVEFLQDIFQLYSPLQQNPSRWESAWRSSMEEACSGGNLKVLQWLMEHLLVRDLLEKMKTNAEYDMNITLFQAAVKRGHVEVMQYLFAMGFATSSTSCVARATVAAVQKDQLVSVKWLAENFWVDNPEQFFYATEEAVEYGRVEVLEFLRNLDKPRTYEALGNKRRQTSDRIFKWSSRLIYWAAWGGQVEALKWLKENRSENSDAGAMNAAATMAHFDTVKWLHANRSEGCTTTAMYRAAQRGNFDMVKFLYENCPESRTTAGIDEVIRFGHIRIADWLRKKHPSYTTSEYSVPDHKGGLVSGSWESTNVLETLFFLREFYPSVFSPYFFRLLREFYTVKEQPSYTAEIVLGWVDANYPSRTESTD